MSIPGFGAGGFGTNTFGTGTTFGAGTSTFGSTAPTFGTNTLGSNTFGGSTFGTGSSFGSAFGTKPATTGFGGFGTGLGTNTFGQPQVNKNNIIFFTGKANKFELRYMYGRGNLRGCGTFKYLYHTKQVDQCVEVCCASS